MHKDELKGFARAWYKVLDFLAKNPDEGYTIMAKGVGGWIEKPEDFKATATGIEYLAKAKNTALFGTEAAPGSLSKTLANAMVI